jgi:putative flippase GtrA
VDLGLFVGLEPTLGLMAADAAALAIAAIVAYLLNWVVTFQGDPMARWVRHPGLFAATALIAGSLDVFVLGLVNRAGLSVAAAKIVAIGCAALVRWSVYRWLLFRRVRGELAQRVTRPDPDRPLRLTVVVPAYNEGDLIAETVAALDAELGPELGAGHYEILVVDDGSSDDTPAVATRAGARVLAPGVNRGKGAAVRAGMLAARGRTVVFTDADLAYPPPLVTRVLHQVEDGWDMVVGSRRHRDTATVVRSPRIRELGGGLINRLTHLVLLGHFRDTQCGLKGFQGDIAKAVFERTRIDGFAFDVELFLIAEQDQLSLVEIPVSVENRATSSVSIVGDTLALLRDLVRIRRWAGAGVYDPTPTQRRLLEARA